TRSYGDWSSDVCSSDLDDGVRMARAILQTLERQPSVRSERDDFAIEHDLTETLVTQRLGNLRISLGIVLTTARPQVDFAVVDKQIGRASCRERGSSTGV